MASVVTEDKQRLHVVPPLMLKGPQARHRWTCKAHFHCFWRMIFLRENSTPSWSMCLSGKWLSERPGGHSALPGRG